MKKLLILVGLSALFFSCSDKGNGKYQGLNGRVKSTTEYEYYATLGEEGWQPGETFTATIKTYDEQGNLSGVETLTGGAHHHRRVDRTEYNAEGYSKYDDQGKLNEDTKTFKISDNEIEYKTYDAEGRLKLTNVTLYKKKMPVEARCTAYYSPGELSIQQLYRGYTGGEEDAYTIEYTYGRNNQIAALNQIGADGTVRDFVRYTYKEYDPQKNWTQRWVYTPESGESPYKIATREIEYYE